MSLSRSYVKAAQGVTKKMFFDRFTYEFTASWEYDSKIDNIPTTIFINWDYFYPESYSLEVTINDQPLTTGFKTHFSSKNHLELTITDKSLHGSLISIRIKPLRSETMM